MNTCSLDAECMKQPRSHVACAPRYELPGLACIPDSCCAQWVTAGNTCSSNAGCPCKCTCVTSICGAGCGFCTAHRWAARASRSHWVS